MQTDNNPNEQVNTVLKEILTALHAVNKTREEKEKLSVLAAASNTLQTNLPTLLNDLAYSPEAGMTYEFYETANEAVLEIIQLRNNAGIRSLLQQTTLPPQLQRLLMLMKKILRHSPTTAELVVEPTENLAIIQRFEQAIAIWDMRQLPHDAELFQAAQAHYEWLEQRIEQLQAVAMTTIQDCERMQVALQKEQEKKNGLISLESQVLFLKKTLLVYAQNLAITLAMEEAMSMGLALDELANAILAAGG